ncbi:MAG: bifunctional demethylmenaquinone methyltransferase/2-methoxy-6-polyprenyl-1,4-benzoquinol methylase UbiE [Syntrophaceae bacterium]|jgi:demethylmenaquinone methyltransferase / 2-methoxy-6-polyprenyl-1,4-benzoquinol methylase|nr:bifunctional demethylmenaquinone methyltransferase/2-methoxy-6-polyprenyl-1,4-benzoquinol methylase UbiE [Syntrophaceae bacterium]
MGQPIPEKYPQVKSVSDQERIRMVREIFSTITGKYDFLNRFLSLRRDVYWRKFAAGKMNFFKTNRYLDVACGTGDLSVAAAKKYPQISVTGLDFVLEMVEAAKIKIQRKGLSGRIQVLQGDALELPFADNSFDVAGIAFGIRNIPDRMRALSEMLRVVVPGGQVMVLEMTFVRSWFLKKIYHLYLNDLLPAFARLFSKNPAAYHYLADSIMHFPSPEAFVAVLEDVGMVDVKKYSLTFGVTWLFVGKKAGG